MSLAELKEAIQVIEADQDLADFDGKKDVALIQLAEQTLGVVFPESYRYFLHYLGCGDIYGREFYGIIKADFANSGIPDAVWLTLRKRQDSGLPDYLVIVYFGGDGDYYAIDCRDPANAPVVLWLPGASRSDDKLEIISNDFGTFFKETILAAKE